VDGTDTADEQSLFVRRKRLRIKETVYAEAFTHYFIDLFIHSCIHLFIHSFDDSFIHVILHNHWDPARPADQSMAF